MKIIISKSIAYIPALRFPLLVALLFVSGCREDKAEIIRQKVAENVQDFRQKKMLECREILLREAEEIVDSLLLTEATNSLNDSLSRLRPFRPVQPPPIPPIDSLTVKPLFNE